MRYLLTLALFVGACTPAPEQPAVEAPGQASPHTANYAGQPVYYVDSGGAASTALVLVHGWASDHTVWEAQLETLPATIRTIAIDLPGHGQSAQPSEPFSMDTFARATAAVLDDAEVDTAILCGHSNGTPVIRQFYRLLPERTKALIAVDGALLRVFPEDLATAMKARLEPETYRETVGGMIDTLPGDGLTAEARAKIKQMALAQPQAAVYGGFLAAADPAIWTEDAIDVPMLVILAEQPTWNAAYLEGVRKLAPDSEIQILSGVSHFIPVERPGEFDARVIAFLETNGFVG